MRSLWMIPLALGLTAGAVEPLENPKGRVALGNYVDRFSDATGTWRGWSISGDWYRDKFGPWSGSVFSSQRPEGTGTTFSLSKEHGFGGNSWVWGGLSLGSGADFLPRWRVDLDSNVGVDGPWGINLGGAFSRYSDGYSVSLLQAGPSWTGATWSGSARVQRIQYGSGGGSDIGCFADFRWGASNLRRWHNFRVAWGKGIFDSLQTAGTIASGGSPAGTGTGSGQGRGKGAGAGIGMGGGSYGSDSNLPDEFLASSMSHFPLTRNLALKAEIGWGKRDAQFNVWTGSLQVLYSF